MKLACADFTFPLLSHEKALQLISMLGFQGVDIGLFEKRSHLWPSQEFKSLKASARQLKKKLKALKLEAADIFLQMATDFHEYATNHPNPQRRRKARDWFLKTLDYAVECGAHHVTVLPGVRFEKESLGDSFDRCAEELAWRVEQSKRKGIIFGTEAHVGSIAPDPKAAEKLVTSVPGLTLTLDYTHFTRSGLPDSSVEKLIPYASHFHVRGARKNRLQTSFANNTIDYKRALRKMKECKYDGWLGIEYVWIDWEHCNECDNLSETLLFQKFILNNQGD